MQLFIGVDEAGRGALAGPVSVGAVLYPKDFDWKEAFRLVTKRGEVKLRDSKKLLPAQREVLYEYIENQPRLKYACALVDATTIDSIGIVPATHRAAMLAVAKLETAPNEVCVLLDAGLKLGEEWTQESFVRGDENIPAIALASIVAKVTRDRYMEQISSDHVGYDFAVHKGYGTAAHRSAIREKGMINGFHRRSFIH